jgi:ASC-1-like (ASCH) protein
MAGGGTMKVHKIKILPEYLKAVTEGRKPFEIRNNDRNYQEGDTVVLQEWTGSKYTGFQIKKQVGFITDYEQKPGYVVFGLV